MSRSIEVLMEVHTVMEWKDGAVFKTARLEDQWVPIHKAQSGRRLGGGKFLVSPGTFQTRRV